MTWLDSNMTLWYRYYKQSYLWLGCGLFAVLISGCGYQLSGYHAREHQEPLGIELKLTDGAGALQTRLTWRLQAYQITIIPQSTNHVHLSGLKINEYRLSGLTSEIKMTATADVSVHMTEQAPFLTQLYAERSYQYTLNTIETDAQQARILTEQMYDEIADQLVRIILAQHQRSVTTLP